MGSLRFRRSFRVGPGLRINVNKRSVGISVGTTGARTTINSNGRSTRSVGIPGTGLSYRSQTGPRRRPASTPSTHPTTTQTFGGALRRLVLLMTVLLFLFVVFAVHSGTSGVLVLVVGGVTWLLLWPLAPIIEYMLIDHYRRKAIETAAPRPSPEQLEVLAAREAALDLGDAIRAEMRARAEGSTSTVQSDMRQRIDEAIEEIVQRRRSGDSLERIEARLGLTRGTVRLVLEGHGLLNLRGRSRTTESDLKPDGEEESLR
jgi:Protein of unknown function (DUF4236)